MTTPQQAAAEVAERAGSIAVQTHQKIVGVVENMSGLPVPALRRDGRRLRHGRRPDASPTASPGRRARRCRCSAPSRSTSGLREGGDEGKPVVLTDPDSPAGAALSGIAGKLGGRQRGLSGMSLGITPGTSSETHVTEGIPGAG